MFTIHYLIIAHHAPEQLSAMINRLQAPFVRFYVHIDQRSDLNSFEWLNKMPGVQICKDRKVCIWGDISLVEATLNLMRMIPADSHPGMVVLLSGQDYPIRSNLYIQQYYQLHHQDQLDYFPLPDPRWEEGGWPRLKHYKINLSANKGDFKVLPPLQLTNPSQWLNWWETHRATRWQHVQTSIRPRKHPFGMQPYGGSQWFALRLETVHKLLEWISQNPHYLDYHQYTLIPDELFFQTLVLHLCEQESAPKPTPGNMYVDWKGRNGQFPAILDETDIQVLVHQPAHILFARKFDAQASPLLLKHLDQAVELQEEMEKHADS
jgi:hypothetical protein